MKFYQIEKRFSNQRSILINNILFLFLFVFISESLFSQNTDLSFSNYNVEQGLSQGNVNVVFQDSRGFIWVGTEDGLNKYDGYAFTIFKADANDSLSISNNVITEIKEDSKGNVWISTRNGLNKYDTRLEQFTCFKHIPNTKESLSNSHINAFDIDKDDNLWIGTANGLNFFNTKSFIVEHFFSNSTNNLLSSNTITAVKIMKDSQVWIGTDSKGLSVYDTNKKAFTQLPADFEKSLQNKTIRAINQDKLSNIWIGSFEGLYITNKNMQEYTHFNCKKNNERSICSNEIYNITFDEDNIGWIATDNGLSKFNYQTKRVTNYLADNNNEHSLSQNILRSVMFDKDKRIWIGSMFGGIDMHDPNKNMFARWANQKDNKLSLPHNNVQNFAEAENGNFWVATDGGGISLYNRRDKTFKSYQNKTECSDCINSNKVIALCKDDEKLWLGSWDGGVVIHNTNKGTFKTYTHNADDENSISSNHIFYIYKDLQQRIWMATWDKGINLYDRENDQFIRLFNDKENLIPEASYLVEDKEGYLWIASQEKGLFKYHIKNKELIQYSKDDQNHKSLNSQIVYSLFIDSKDRLWVGTKDGLNLHLGNGDFKAYTTYHGLPNNIIYGIEEDKNGYLWVSTNFGISRFHIDSESFRNFSHKDGLQGSQFNRRAIQKLPSGEILFGGINGFNLIDPENIKENNIPPLVYLTQLKIGNEIVNPNTNGVLKNALAYSSELTLNHKQNFLSFDFIALNFTQNEKNRYQYMLEGLDEEYSTLNTNRSAVYTNLNPGNYTFKVKATNSDGVYSENENTIQLTIIAPWWKRLWFRLLIIIFVSSIGIIAYRLRIKRIKKQRALLQQTVENRTKELKTIMKITKDQSNKISDLGDVLKNKSEVLATGVDSQTQTASVIEQSIDDLTQHTNATQNNVQKTDKITFNTLKELEQIKISTEKNIKEISSIAEKTNILNDIFMQTNILAINAAIEAQHAGEHGKGFGTVADEVRRLADQSRDASQEIMESSKTGANATRIDGERLIQFIPEINKVAQLIKEISNASAEQHDSITNINASLKEFFKTSNTHTATAKEIAAISVSLNEMATYLKEHMMKVEL